MARSPFPAGWPGCLLVLSLAAALAGVPAGARAAEVVAGTNGITATLHGAGEIADRMLERRDGGLWLVHPAVGRVELLDGPQDPRLPRDDVTAFHPYPVDQVAAAISSVHGIAPELAVTVFLLPSPPAETLCSYAERDVILLSPGFGPPPPGTVAYVSTHELGHVLTWAYLDARPDRWLAYRSLRGLTADDGGGTPHAERPREVLAEDIRYLFGGPLATASGTIENHALPAPDLVPGLRQLLAGWLQGPPATALLARSRAFPNPCNPSTTITLELPADVAPAAGSCWIELYDVRGCRVRRLSGGPLAQGRVGGSWDGRDESGRLAASGRYLYVIRGGGLQARGAVLLVR